MKFNTNSVSPSFKAMYTVNGSAQKIKKFKENLLSGSGENYSNYDLFIQNIPNKEDFRNGQRTIIVATEKNATELKKWANLYGPTKTKTTTFNVPGISTPALVGTLSRNSYFNPNIDVILQQLMNLNLIC